METKMSDSWLHRMDEAFETPLSRAEHADHSVLTQLMIQQEQGDFESVMAESSVLHRAAAMGVGYIVEELLGEGKDPDLRNAQGETALHMAARNGHTDIAEILVAAGANANAVNHQGLTPLHWAALTGDTAMTELLISAGADPQVAAAYLDGLTPLTLVRIMGYTALTHRLSGLTVA